MPGTSFRLLQAFLWSICAFHVLVGVGVNTSQGFMEMMAGYYGAQVQWTPQFVYILKPLGAFMFVLGMLAGAAALKPLQYRIVVYGFVVLFAIRALQRLVFKQAIYDAFAISPARDMASMVLFFAMAASLFALHRRVERGAGERGEAR